jgi:hypothetical protein
MDTHMQCLSNIIPKNMPCSYLLEILQTVAMSRSIRFFINTHEAGTRNSSKSNKQKLVN